MSVQQSELVWRKSATGSSDGGGVSGVATVSGLKNDVWPSVTDVQRVAGITQYKKLFVCNDSLTDALILPGIWIYQPPTNIAQSIGLGFDDVNDADPAQGNMTAWAAPAVAALISDGVDTRTVRIVGINSVGSPVSENVVLTGAVEVLSTTNWSVVNAAHLSAQDAARTVLIKQGHLGTTRGTLGPNKVACWLWNAGVLRANGLLLPNLPGLSNYGVWIRHVVAPGAGGVRPDSDVIAVQEG